MSFKTIYTEDGGIIYEAFGVLTDNDLIEFNKEHYQDDDRIKQISYQILDTTKVEKVDVSIEQIHRNAEMDKRALSINPKMRVAILGNTDLQFGLGRMWETYACQIPGYENSCKIFRDIDDIKEWIKSEQEEP